MFYIKTKLASGKVVRADITDENVFTCCPGCGSELPVDLVEVMSDGRGDLYGTAIYCASCTKKRIEKRAFMDSVRITVDGVTLLADVLCQAGYSEQVYEIFDRFDIDNVSDLTPMQLRPFADALSDLAAEGGRV